MSSILIEVLYLDESRVRHLTRGTSLEDGLEADSVARLQIVEAAEARFGVCLDDEERLNEIRNIGDVCDWIDELRPENDQAA